MCWSETRDIKDLFLNRTYSLEFKIQAPKIQGQLHSTIPVHHHEVPLSPRCLCRSGFCFSGTRWCGKRRPQKGTLFFDANPFIRSVKLFAPGSPAQASKMARVPSIPLLIYLTRSQQTLRMQPPGLPLLLCRHPPLTESYQKLILRCN